MTVFWILVVALTAAGAVVHRAFMVIVVDGESMTPTYEPGDRVLVLRRWISRRPRVGDVVVVPFPGRRPGTPFGTQSMLIKRVTSVSADGTANMRLQVQGDGPRSFDSRDFGSVARSRVVGRVVAQLEPP